MTIKQGNNKFYIGDDEDHIKALISYVYNDDSTIILDHTFVSQELRGQNIGNKLVKKVIDFARENNKKIIPQCSFAKNEFIVHKEYDDVLYK